MSRRNPLHQYVNWTYNLSIYALSIKEFNKNVYETPTLNLGGTLLMASGGKQAGRNQHFKEDFYLDNFKFSNTPPSTTKGRNTTVVDMSITIIEPMGVTLFNRLIAVSKELGIETYREMPYYIKIEWKGWNIDGTPANIPMTKVIPFKITTMGMKINQQGARYEVTMTAVAHQNFMETVGGTPVRVEASGSKVGEIILYEQKSPAPKGAPEDPPMVKGVAPTDDHIRSYTGAVNTWFANQAAEQHAKYHDTIAFELTYPMHGGKLVKAEHMTPQGGYFPTPGTAAADQTTIKTMTRPKAQLNSNISFAQGTSIHEVMSAILRESDWIGNQSGDEQDGGGPGKPQQVKWFRIIPRIEYKDWEPRFNRYTKNYVYRVVPYMVNNTYNRAFPIIDTMPTALKDYQYIFTGKNDDILDLELNFDNLWYNMLTTNQENRYSVSGGQEVTPTLDPKAHGGASGMAENYKKLSSGDKGQFGCGVFPVAYTAATVKMNDGSKNEKAREMQENIMSRYGNASMMTAMLKIIGDPDWICQDDVMFWNVKSASHTPNGSINQSASEVAIQITALSASDYNDVGLAIPGTGKYSMGAFSGRFMVTMIESTFAGGKFTQVLTCSRIQNQPPAGI